MAKNGIPDPQGDSLESLARAARAPLQGTKKSAGTRSLREQPRTGVPRWYRIVSPLLVLMGGLLLMVGAWAVGAVLYMHRVKPIAPEDIQYPLLQWSDSVGTSGGYAPESQWMAYGMLACIPVGLAMGAISLLIRGQVRSRR